MMSSRPIDGLTPLRRFPALLIAGFTACVLVAASWGHVSVFWGDYGKWLFEIQEVANGKQLYTGVYWPQLPLAAWVFGAWARLAGTELQDVWTLTAALALAVSLLFAEYCRLILPGLRTLWVIPSALVMAFGASSVNGAPLGMGMYTPSAPLGVGCLMISLILAHRLIGARTPLPPPPRHCARCDCSSGDRDKNRLLAACWCACRYHMRTPR